MASNLKAKYLGPTQHTRVLTVKDQKDLGATNPTKDLVWDSAHGHVLGLADVDEAVVDFLKASPLWAVGAKVNAQTKTQPGEDASEDEPEDLGPIPSGAQGPAPTPTPEPAKPSTTSPR